MKVFLIFFILSSACGIKMDCEFGPDWWGSDLTGLESLYSCKIASMDIRDNATHLIEVTGEHLSGKSNSDVIGIFVWYTCSEYHLEYFPKGILNFFPNFAAIRLDGCPIDHLNGDELNEYPNIERFAISRSTIVRVPGNLFAMTPNIKQIIFSHNKIEYVGAGLLDNLPKLIYVNFINNTCIEMRAENSGEMCELKEILRNNCMDLGMTTSIWTTKPSIDPCCQVMCKFDADIKVLDRDSQMLDKLQAKIENLSRKVMMITEVFNNIVNRIEMKLTKETP